MNFVGQEKTKTVTLKRNMMITSYCGLCVDVSFDYIDPLLVSQESPKYNRVEFSI